ncbi:MAG TPA: hypothetical protein VHW44_06175 [Pseudonocardiaceae bacterium]|jgi:hypothetical protein|nr:hypothetical protein [Pseudonocardiaceae bacterium]
MVGATEAKTESDNSGPLPIFTGADRIARLIGALYQRPRFGDRPRDLHETDIVWGELIDRRERPGRKGLPMVCLVRSGDQIGLLRGLDHLLDEAKPRGVRHAYQSLSDTSGLAAGSFGPPTNTDPLSTADVLTIRNILRTARNQLINSPRARNSQLRFPLFTLADWLLSTRKKKNDQNPDATLRRQLQRQGIVERLIGTTKTISDELPEGIRWKIPVWLLRALTLLTFRLAVTGRVPILSGRYRWFLRQPHLAPEMSGTFVRFAERLIEGEWQKEAPEYVARLLVNSFLEDLRRGYQIRPWHVFRARRMTYPVLLLDNITMTNGGYALLQLINDVRNQVGAFDPLLVISGSTEVPPDAGRRYADRPHSGAAGAADAYRAWQRDLLTDRRARRDTAWYLPIQIPATPAEPEKSGAERKLRAFNGYTVGFRASRPALLGSRWLRLGVVLIVLAGAAVGSFTWYQNHCDTWHSSLTRSGAECIGVTDGSFDLFQPSDPTIQQVVDTVYAQNQQAERLHAVFPQRPYITLADLEAITSGDGTADGLTAERESLEGIAVAQQRQLNKTGSSDPIVRILLANGGQAMRQGVTVAQQLGSLAAADPTLVGVVGLDMSSGPTVNTITALADAGLPMVAATLSADTLAETTPMYFQVAPQNNMEAAVLASFADQHATTTGTPRTVRIYYSDDATDIYSSNLRTDTAAAFTARGFQVQSRAYSPSGAQVSQAAHTEFGDQLVGNAVAAGQDTCAYNGFVVFAGRGVPDYGDFLSGASQCVSKAVIIGDDDVTRYVADATERESNRTPPFYYASFAPAPIGAPQGPELDFYADLNALFPFEVDKSQSRSLDGHAALSYDAALVLITAVSYLREGNGSIPITPGTVWREITDIHTSTTNPDEVNKYIEGVTGAIDFGGDITRHVPLRKPVAILQVNGGEVQPNLVTFCGTASGHTQSSWCPPGA